MVRRYPAIATTIAMHSILLACARPAPPVAEPNDLRIPAGAGAVGELAVALEARPARWRPSAADGPALEVATFGEVGRPPTVPGPLIRVAAGTTVAITLVNRLADTLLVTGLIDPRARDTMILAPGAIGEARFRAERPGLYGYFGITRRGDLDERGGKGGQLAGVIAVDSVGAIPDRIFAITAWNGPKPVGEDSTFVMAINGRMWPHTPRERIAVGDSVHWRVINFANSSHPMHLHGTYFRVDARGDWTGDTAYSAAEHRLAVTEVIRLRETMAITWSPARAGRWLFHCHDAFHVAHSQEIELPLAARLWAAELRGDPSNEPAPPHHPESVAHGMSGLVVGIDVTGPAESPTAPRPRRIDLTVQQRDRVFGDSVGIGFVLGRPGTVAADSIAIPGPPLVLERDQPVAITVHNRLAIPTSVHWHGIELESFFDGVGGWSGTTARTAPSIAPADSFVARFAPPRAGTFIYHSHFSEVRQLGLGLFGPLIVLEPGARWDPDRDRVILYAMAGVAEDAPIVAHHSGTPLRQGVPYRLRFVNITAADDVAIEAIQGGAVMTWREVAKDGADLPIPVTRAARLLFGPGETIDVEITPAAGPITLRTTSYNDFETILAVR